MQQLPAGVAALLRQPPPSPSIPIGRRIAAAAAAWALLPQRYAQQAAARGVRLELAAQPAARRAPTWTSDPALITHISELEKEHIIERVRTDSEEVNGCQHRVFAVPKPDGGIRMIYDARYLNEHIVHRPFKMQGIATALQLLRQGDWMYKVDVKKAYCHVPMAAEQRRLLQFEVNGTLYRFTTLPFGVSSAPRLFSKLLRPVQALLGQCGIRSVFYLDDLLVLGDTMLQAERNGLLLRRLLQALGFTVNEDKSSVEARQHLEFLGLELDARNMTLSVPASKVRDLRRDLRRATARSQTPRSLSTLLGKLRFVAPAVHMAGARLAELQRLKNECRRRAGWDGVVQLTERALDDIEWWLHTLVDKGAQRFELRPSVVLVTDASSRGWGAARLDNDAARQVQARVQMGGSVAASRLPPEELWNSGTATARGFWGQAGRHRRSNNFRELKAILNGLDKLVPRREDGQRQDVLILTDNSTAASCIRRWYSPSPRLLALVTRVAALAEERQLRLVSQHVPGTKIGQADTLSRAPRDDWKLKPDVFRRVQQRLDLRQPCSIDLFASRTSTQLPVYVSRERKDLVAAAHDAFSLSWSRLTTPWMFPPFRVLNNVVNKLRIDRPEEGVLVVPDWPSAPWYPAAMGLAKQTHIIGPWQRVLQYEVPPSDAAYNLLALRL